MVNHRNARRKGEATFLEQVLSCLESLQHEVGLIKTLLEPDILPPPAPPPMLDTYNRDFLLLQRAVAKDWSYKPILPKCSRLMSTDSPNDRFGCTSERDEIIAFLEKEGHYEKTATADWDMRIISQLIENAQRTAANLREKEYRAVGRIQRFWRSCKKKVATRFNYYHASNEQVGDTGSPTPEEIPGLSYLSDVMRDAFVEIVRLAVDLPEAECNAFIYKAIRGMAERKDISHLELQRTLDVAETVFGAELCSSLQSTPEADSSSVQPNDAEPTFHKQEFDIGKHKMKRYVFRRSFTDLNADFVGGFECAKCGKNHPTQDQVGCDCAIWQPRETGLQRFDLTDSPPSRIMVEKLNEKNDAEEIAIAICGACATLYDQMYSFCRMCGYRRLKHW
mmetsp:Transcript_99376/g.157201  ORF Transcript_99376/g.157201 Transcript_99376/m.157201 type:complete len:393 (+) Transcript_99376:153-1331(+)